ncbi:transposase [Pseudomonas sp. IT-P258]
MSGELIACSVNARLIRHSKYKKGGLGRPFLWPLPLHYRTQARQDLSDNKSREAIKFVQE